MGDLVTRDMSQHQLIPGLTPQKSSLLHRIQIYISLSRKRPKYFQTCSLIYYFSFLFQQVVFLPYIATVYYFLISFCFYVKFLIPKIDQKTRVIANQVWDEVGGGAIFISFGVGVFPYLADMIDCFRTQQQSCNSMSISKEMGWLQYLSKDHRDL